MSILYFFLAAIATFTAMMAMGMAFGHLAKAIVSGGKRSVFILILVVPIYIALFCGFLIVEGILVDWTRQKYAAWGDNAAERAQPALRAQREHEKGKVIVRRRVVPRLSLEGLFA